MTKRKMIALALAVFSTGILSCTSMARQMSLPDAKTVTQVKITWASDSQDKQEHVIVDPNNIERLLSFVNKHNNSWHMPLGTFPAPLYTISFKRDKDVLLVLWIGSNWIGGRERGGDASDNQLRTLSAVERTELLETLGIPVP